MEGSSGIKRTTSSTSAPTILRRNLTEVKGRKSDLGVRQCSFITLRSVRKVVVGIRGCFFKSLPVEANHERHNVVSTNQVRVAPFQKHPNMWYPL